MADDEPSEQPDDDKSPFERYVRAAIANSRRVHTVTALRKEAGFHQNTLYDLFKRNVEAPGGPTMAKIAEALDVPISDLWATWQGLEPEPNSVQEALRRHTAAMNEQNRLLGMMVAFIRSAAEAVVQEEEVAEGESLADTVVRTTRAVEGSGSRARPPVPRGTKG